MCTIYKLIWLSSAMIATTVFAQQMEIDRLKIATPYSCEVGYSSKLAAGDWLVISNQVIYGDPPDKTRPAGINNMRQPLRVLNHWAVFSEENTLGKIRFKLLYYVRLDPNELIRISPPKGVTEMNVMVYGSSVPFVPGATLNKVVPKQPESSTSPSVPLPAPKKPPAESKPDGKKVTV